MPFSWQNPPGFILTMIFEAIVDLISIATYVPLVTYFIGSCWLFICILNDSPTLSSGNGTSTIANTSDAADDTELKEDFCKMVQFYSDVKELSRSA